MENVQTLDEDRPGIQVIARAATVLRALEDEPDGLSLGELAARVGLARSTVQRIVAALLDERFLMPASAASRVKIGPAIVRLGAAANLDIGEIVRPMLQDLARELEETVDLSVLRGRVAVFVDQVSGPHRLAAISAIGDAFQLHCSANGKAILACLTPERRKVLLKGPLERLTPATVTDKSELEHEMETIAATGLAFDEEEHSEGVSACGVAFLDGSGRYFALSTPAPTARFARKRDEIATALLRAKAKLSSLLS